MTVLTLNKLTLTVVTHTCSHLDMNGGLCLDYNCILRLGVNRSYTVQ